MNTRVTELLILVMLNSHLAQSQEAAVSDYPASSAIDLATEFSPTTYADVYPTFLQIFTSESQLVEPTMSATVSESYSIRAQSELVSEFPSIVTVAPMAQPTSSLGYPAASDLYHTSALISSAASTVKSLYTQTGYQITSSNLHYTESPNYTYTTTAMSFSPQSSSETKTIHSSRSSLYVTRDTRISTSSAMDSSSSASLISPSSLVIVNPTNPSSTASTSPNSSCKDAVSAANSTTIYTELIFATSVVIIAVSLIIAITIILVVYRIKPKVHAPISGIEEEQVYVNSSAIESKSNAESIPILDCPEPDSVEMKMKEEITEPNDYEPVSYETEMEDETITKL